MDPDSSAPYEVWSTESAFIDKDIAVTGRQHTVAEPAANEKLAGFASCDTLLLRDEEYVSSLKAKNDVRPEEEHDATESSSNETSTCVTSFDTRFNGMNNMSPLLNKGMGPEISSKTDLNVFSSIYDAFGSYVFTGKDQDFGEDAFHRVKNEIVSHDIVPSLDYRAESLADGGGVDSFVKRGSVPVDQDNNLSGDKKNSGRRSSVTTSRDFFVDHGKGLSDHCHTETFANQGRIDPYFDRNKNDPFVNGTRNNPSMKHSINRCADRYSPISSTDSNDDSVFIPGILPKENAPITSVRRTSWPHRKTHIATRVLSTDDHSSHVQSSTYQENANAVTDRELLVVTPQQNRFQAIMRFTPKSIGGSPTGTVTTTPTMSPQTQRIACEILKYRERILERYGPQNTSPFKPSRWILESTGADSQAMITRDGTAARYRAGSDSQLLAGHFVADNENCAIWITGIPAEATYSDLLNAVRGGKVFACLMNRPNGDFATSAAKLVFFRRDSAVAFLGRAACAGVWVLGQRIKAQWNRIRYPEYQLSHQSRVVLISGPAEWMSFDFFEVFFSQLFQYDLESHFEMACNRRGWKLHVWKFASLRAQAESAKMAIERELGRAFRVDFGPDPCALPWF